MDKIILKANERKILGRKVKTLRKVGLLPGVVYGKGVKSASVCVALKAFQDAYKKAGETGIVELMIGSSKKPVLIHNIQLNPVSGEPIHADFLQVNLKEQVNATVPVEISGESPAEKSGLGTIVAQLNEIEVRALPLDLPEKFVVDVSKLIEVDQAIFVKDLDVDKLKVEIKTDLESIIVKVETPQKEEVIEQPKAEGEAAPQTEGEVKAEETPEAKTEGDVQENLSTKDASGKK